MGKKNFRARITDRPAAAYPSLLEDSGRRSFLRVLGGGLFAAAVGQAVTGCDGSLFGTSTAGLPDMQHSPFDASVEQPADSWFLHDTAGLPDMGRDVVPPDQMPPQDLPYTVECGGPDANVQQDSWFVHDSAGLPDMGQDMKPPDSGSKDSGSKDNTTTDSKTSDATADAGERPDLVVIKP